MMKRLKVWAAESWYATLTTVIAAVSALLGSVYADEIRTSFPLALGPYDGFSGWALVFWSSLTVFAFLFFLRQSHDDENRATLHETASNLVESTANIKNLIETLPPRQFQWQFAKQSAVVLASCSSVMPRKVNEGTPPADVATFIRSLLHAITNLAWIYDDPPQSAVYAANVMLFVKAQRAGERFTPEHVQRIRFIQDPGEVHSLQGILLLRKDLSCVLSQDMTQNASTESLQQDESVPLIALPVPETTKRGDRWAVLPGAPKAFAGDDEFDGYTDVRTLAEWCETRGDFAPSVIAQVRTYFESGDGNAIRSFISVRLMDGSESCAVLNLHSNCLNLLGPVQEKRNIFLAMLTPLLMELSGAVSELQRLEAGTPQQ